MNDVYVVTLSRFGKGLEQGILGIGATEDIGMRIGNEYLRDMHFSPRWEKKPGSSALYSIHAYTIVTVFPMLLEER